MQKSELEEGKQYAVRVRPGDSKDPLTKARYLGPAKAGRARVRHGAGPLDGLDEWIKTRTIMCRWADRSAFLRDEEHENQLREVSDASRDLVVEAAISGVMESSGDSTGFIGTWTGDPEWIRRMWRRAGLEGDPLLQPHAYLDRHGIAHLSYESALTWSIAFAGAVSEPVLTWLEAWEERLRAEGWQPGNRYAHDYLREISPSHALMREWAGREGRDLAQHEIKRLRYLLMEAIDSLERTGAEDEARRLRRALVGS